MYQNNCVMYNFYLTAHVNGMCKSCIFFSCALCKMLASSHVCAKTIVSCIILILTVKLSSGVSNYFEYIVFFFVL
jgi:hypothetical protein